MAQYDFPLASLCGLVNEICIHFQVGLSSTIWSSQLLRIEMCSMHFIMTKTYMSEVQDLQYHGLCNLTRVLAGKFQNFCSSRFSYSCSFFKSFNQLCTFKSLLCQKGKFTLQPYPRRYVRKRFCYCPKNIKIENSSYKYLPVQKRAV